jgi:hypothetical protein
MKRILCATTAIATVLTALTAIGSAAPKFKVLHAFGKSGDGAGTWGSLTLGRPGNLFGATSGGGGQGCNGQGCGTAFELIRGANGKWKEHILYSFKGGSDATGPFGALVFDPSGNLYGTTIPTRILWSVTSPSPPTTTLSTTFLVRPALLRSCGLASRIPN